MTGHDIIVVGASAGGVETLTQLVGSLPKRLPAAVFVVLHVPPTGSSVLPQILQRAGLLPCAFARDGEAIERGRIYVAPPDHHLLVTPRGVRLYRGPSENGHRPAVDPLFRSAAVSFGPRVVGVVLSGTRDDGTSGLHAIKAHGGIAVVQDPETALFPGMPRSAIENVAVDYVLPIDQIGPLLVRLAEEPLSEEQVTAATHQTEEIEAMNESEIAGLSEGVEGTPVALTCPVCGGSLSEIWDGEIVRFKCRVGHAYSPDSLLESQGDVVEAALWAALNALEERAALARRLAARTRLRGRELTAASFEEQARRAMERAEVIRQVLMRGAESGDQQVGQNPLPGVRRSKVDRGDHAGRAEPEST